tara:strand:+ start:3959 stop:4243 length:285 start_codon:yes stop_codon:yes gene_type:complete
MRTIDDVLRDYDVILRGRTRYEGKPPRDDELMIAEIKRLRDHSSMLRNCLKDVLGWIHNWGANFEQDDEWPETKNKCRAVLATTAVESEACDGE